MAFIKLIINCIEDILIISGLAFIVIATFLLSKVAGLYCLGSCMLLLGIYFTKFPIAKR